MRFTVLWLSLPLQLLCWLARFFCFVFVFVGEGFFLPHEVLVFTVFRSFLQEAGLCLEGLCPFASLPISLVSGTSSSRKHKAESGIPLPFSNNYSDYPSTAPPSFLLFVSLLMFTAYSFWHRTGTVRHIVDTQEILNKWMNAGWLYMGKSYSSQVKN